MLFSIRKCLGNPKYGLYKCKHQIIELISKFMYCCIRTVASVTSDINRSLNILNQVTDAGLNVNCFLFKYLKSPIKKIAQYCLNFASNLNFLICFIIKYLEGMLILHFFHSVMICIMIKR